MGCWVIESLQELLTYFGVRKSFAKLLSELGLNYREDVTMEHSNINSTGNPGTCETRVRGVRKVYD